jgi:hypothetical protein
MIRKAWDFTGKSWIGAPCNRKEFLRTIDTPHGFDVMFYEPDKQPVKWTFATNEELVAKVYQLLDIHGNMDIIEGYM